MPQTLWDDNDALDIAVITTYPLYPGIMVRARPVGIIRMIDDGESDDKVISVPVDDPRFDEVQDIQDVNKHRILEIQHFFSTYKQMQNKVVTIQGVGTAAEAKQAFERACKMYKESLTK